MIINLQKLREIMNESGIPYFRDEAPTSQSYPYIIYEFVDETHRRASNSVLASLPLYQIAVVSEDTERAYKPLQHALEKYQVSFGTFSGGPYDENDSRITQYVTYVRCVDE